MAALRVELDALEQAECPFDVRPPRAIAQRAHWVRPVLLAGGESAVTSAYVVVRCPV